MSDHESNPTPEQEQSQPPAASSTDTRRQPAPPQTKPLPRWKVLLHNDDINEMEYVVRTIMSLTTIEETAAVKKALEAHEAGLSLLLTTHQERAELFQQQFQSANLTVTIEPEEK